MTIAKRRLLRCQRKLSAIADEKSQTGLLLALSRREGRRSCFQAASPERPASAFVETTADKLAVSNRRTVGRDSQGGKYLARSDGAQFTNSYHAVRIASIRSSRGTK